MNSRNNPIYFILLISLFFIVGSLIYAYGFTSSSITSSRHSPKGNPYASEMQYKDKDQQAIYEKQWFPTQSSQVIFLIMDSLPYYYVVNEEDQQKKLNQAKEGLSNDPSLKIPSRDVPFTEFLDRLSEDPENTVLLKAFSHPPTYTSLRVKAMLQGILPSYDQMTANLGSKEMVFDNIVTQAKKNNPFIGEQREKVVCYAGIFWGQLYPNIFDRGNFVGENHLYKREENDIIQFENIVVEQLKNDDWSSMFIHFYGIDDSSHLTDQYDDALRQTIEAESVLTKKLIQNIKDSTVNTDQTLIIVSDHGINYEVNGHHGGYSALESNTFMFGFSRNSFITKDKRDFGQNMDREFLTAPDVFQINVTPTYCMLLGVPIPNNNLGMISPDFFLDKPEIDDFVVANNFYTNFRQIEDGFIEKVKEFTGEVKKIEELKKLSLEIKQKYNNLFIGKEGEERKVNQKGLKEFVQLCQKYSVEVVSSIQRDLQDPKLQYMYIGCVIHFVLAVFILMILASLKIISFDTQAQMENIFIQVTGLISKSKIILVSFIIISAIANFIFSVTTFMIFEGAFCLILIALLCTLKYKVLINQCKLSLKTIINSYDLVQVIDLLIIISSFTLFTLMRTSNDYFNYSINVFSLYFQLICAVLVALVLIRKSEGQINSLQDSLQLILKIVSIPALFFVCKYYNLNAFSKYYDPPPFYDELIGNPLYKYYIPLVIFLSFFGYLFYKIWQRFSEVNFYLRALFLYFHAIQLISVATYYLCQWKILNIENSPSTLPASALFHTIIIEIVKTIMFQKKWLPKVSTSYKVAYFLLNTGAGFACILEWNSLIQLPIYFYIAYTLCSIFVQLKSISFTSIVCILLYLSQFFFQLSGHVEFFEELHTDVFQVGVVIEKSYAIPIFNGFINTVYYFLVTPALLPLIINLMKLDQQELNKVGIFSVIFELTEKDKRIQEQETQQVMSQEFFAINFTDEQELRPKEMGKSNQEQEGEIIQVQEIAQTNYYFLLMLAHVLIGMLGADIRNIVKPMDTSKESVYVPNYMFQMVFLISYLISISLNSLFLQPKKPKKHFSSISQLDVPNL